MKKTFFATALAFGLIATAQASLTQTWTLDDLAGGNGTLTVPTSATAGSGYGNFTLTAVLDVAKVTEAFTDNEWCVILGMHSAKTEGVAYGLTLNGSQSVNPSTNAGIYAAKTTEGTLTTNSNNTGFGSSISDSLEGTLRGDTKYTDMAITVEVNGAGITSYLTLVDENGAKTNYTGTVSANNTNGWRHTQFGHLGAITYDADFVKSLSLYSTNLTADEAYRANASAIPEPTTATLSLLALAGLAARRRRK